MSNNSKLQEYWKKTQKLMFTVLGVWFFFAYFIHLFVGSLNEISFFGFPLGYYMAAQGSLLAFVILIFFYAARQNSIDKEFDFQE